MTRVIPTSALLAWMDTVDREYWLAHCEGFVVRRGGRRLGRVAYVEYVSCHQRPHLLHLQGGLLGNRSVRVRTRDVELVDARDGTIWLVEDAVVRRSAPERAPGRVADALRRVTQVPAWRRRTL